jgi:branched-chain amino acid transport system substrate-binding protein
LIQNDSLDDSQTMQYKPTHRPPHLNPHVTGAASAALRCQRLIQSVALTALLMVGFHGGALHAQAKLASDIKLGMVVPLTGPLANTGNDIALGTQAAIDVANQAGGIKGRRVDLLVEDDAFDAKQSEALATDLVKNKGVVGLLSCFGTVNCLAVAKVAQTLNVPLLGPIAGSPALRDSSQSHVFSVRASASEEVGALLNYLSGNGLNNVAVIVQDDGFGKAYASALESAGKAYRFSPSLNLKFDPKAAKYSEIIQPIIDGKTPAAIIFFTNTTHSLGLIKALNDGKYYGQVLNLAGQTNAGFVKGLTQYNQLAVFATVTPSPFASSNLASQEYRTAWKRLTGNENYSYVGFEAYLNARIMLEALKRSAAPTATALDTALSQIKGLNINGLEYTFAGKQRQAASFTDLAMLSKGQFKH